jgi:hypothetical protein
LGSTFAAAEQSQRQGIRACFAFFAAFFTFGFSFSGL